MGFISVSQVVIPWDRTFKEVWNSGALFISGFRILEGLLTMLGFLKTTAPFDIESGCGSTTGTKMKPLACADVCV